MPSAVPRWVLALFALGIAIRIALMVVYAPAALQNPDTISYLTLAPFHDTRQPSGIYLFVAPFRSIGSVGMLVLAEHALGVLAAGLLAAAARRLGCGWVATAGVAAVALLASDELYVEHAVLTEPLFTALAAGALLAALPGACAGGLPSALVAGTAAGAALCTRTVGSVVVVAVAASLLLVDAAPMRRRLLRSGAALAATAVVLGAYLLGVGATSNGHAGITDWSGWYAYARSASFADCHRFAPPAGTRMLCETTPTDQRSGPSFYMFDPASPARRAFGGPPNGGAVLGRFGRAAILGEQAAYAHVVLRDLLRYVDDAYGSVRPGFGGGYDTIALDRRDPVGEPSVARQASGGSFGTIAPPVVHAQHLVQLYASNLRARRPRAARAARARGGGRGAHAGTIAVRSVAVRARRARAARDAGDDAVVRGPLRATARAAADRSRRRGRRGARAAHREPARPGEPGGPVGPCGPCGPCGTDRQRRASRRATRSGSVSARTSGCFQIRSRSSTPTR